MLFYSLRLQSLNPLYFLPPPCSIKQDNSYNLQLDAMCLYCSLNCHSLPYQQVQWSPSKQSTKGRVASRYYYYFTLFLSRSTSCVACLFVCWLHSRATRMTRMHVGVRFCDKRSWLENWTNVWVTAVHITVFYCDFILFL